MRHLRGFALALVAILVSAAYTAWGMPAPRPVPSERPTSAGAICDGGQTALAIFNLDTANPMAFETRLFHQSGQRVNPIRVTDVPAGAIWVGIPMGGQLPGGAYAAVVEADRRIDVNATTYWDCSGGYIAHGPAEGATEVWVPGVVRTNTHQSLVSVQNLDEQAPVEVTVASFEPTGGEPLFERSYTIGRGTSTTLDVAKDAGFVALPNGYLGAFRVTAAKPIAVMHVINVESSPHAVLGTAGQPAGAASPLLFVPRIAADVPTSGTAPASAASTLLVANPGHGAVDVLVRYFGSSASCANQEFVHGGGAKHLPAGGTLSFAAGAAGTGSNTGASGLPAGCLASARIEATGGPVLAAVMDETTRENEVAAASLYNAVKTGSRHARIFGFRDRFQPPYSLSTELSAMNTGDTAAQVTLTLGISASLTGFDCGAPCTATLAPGEAVHWTPQDIPGLPTLPNGSMRHAAVEGSQPLAVVARDVSANQFVDEAAELAVNTDAPAAPDAPMLRAVNIPFFYSANVDVPPSSTPSTPVPTPMPTATPQGAGPKGALITGIQIQNLNPLDTMHVTVDAWHTPDGQKWTDRPMTVAGGKSATFYAPLFQDVPTGDPLPYGLYSGILSSDQPSAAMATLAGEASRSGAFFDSAPPSSDLVVPLALLGYQFQNTVLAIQNANPNEPVDATITLYDAGGDVAAVVTRTLPAGTASLLDLGRDAELLPVATGFVGSLRVQSDGPLAVNALVDVENSARAIYGFNGEPAAFGAHTLFVPRIRSSDPAPAGAPAGTTYSTRIAVVNPAAAPVQVTVHYQGLSGTCQGNLSNHGAQTYTLVAHGQLLFDQGPAGTSLPTGESGLPAGCAGSARVEASGDVVGVVVETASRDDVPVAASATNAFTHLQANASLQLPILATRKLGTSLKTMDVIVMNVGNAATDVELKLQVGYGSPVEQAPCGAPCRASLEPGATKTFRLDDLPGWMASMGDGIIVGGTGTLVADQPIVATVVDTARNLDLDDAAYRAQSADVPLDGIASTRHLFPILAHRAMVRLGGPAVNQPAPGGAVVQGRMVYRMFLPSLMLRPAQEGSGNPPAHPAPHAASRPAQGESN